MGAFAIVFVGKFDEAGVQSGEPTAPTITSDARPLAVRRRDDAGGLGASFSRTRNRWFSRPQMPVVALAIVTFKMLSDKKTVSIAARVELRNIFHRAR